MSLVSCTYCGKTFETSTLTPLYEKGKTLNTRYCDRCVPEVKVNIRSLHWSHLYTWGKRGDEE